MASLRRRVLQTFQVGGAALGDGRQKKSVNRAG
jgi:hypothetical protein